MPPWHHGPLSRPEVNDLLPRVEGSFLVRDGRKGNVLSVFIRGSIQHFVIQNINGKFRIDDGPMYNTLPDLINFYMHDPASPTRLTTPVKKAMPPDAAPPPALAPRGGATGAGKSRAPLPPLPPAEPEVDPAPALLPRTSTSPLAPVVIDAGSANNMYGNVESPVAAEPEPEPEPVKPAAPLPVIDTGPDFSKLKVDESHSKTKLSIDNIQLEEQEIVEDDGAHESNERRRQFEREATASEKFNIFWLNQKLSAVGAEKVDNVKEALRSGVVIMQVLEHLSGKKARYTKKPKLEVQFRDNWASIVNFMRTLGIQVDGDGVKGSGDDETVDVSLSELKCMDLDRRELLKDRKSVV